MNRISLIDKAFFLKRSPLFNALDLDLLLAIADKVQPVSFAANEVIFSQNEEAFRIYFIFKGSVDILNDDDVLIATLGADQFFGDESLFSDKPRGYHAVSRSETILLTLSRTNLLTIISECPAVAIGLLQSYCGVVPFRPRA